MLKTCTECQVDKELSEFNKKTETTLRSKCKDCMRKKNKQHYQNNKQYYIDKAMQHNKKYKLANRQFVWDYLKEHPCVDCQESDPVVLEFDHLQDKTGNIADLILKSNSLTKIKLEIEKCQVRCANCHRRKTASQLGWYKDLNLILHTNKSS